jgi:hypothetical protein
VHPATHPHVWQRRLGGVEGGVEAHRNDVVPLVLWEGVNWGHVLDACIVHQDVQATKVVGDLQTGERGWWVSEGMGGGGMGYGVGMRVQELAAAGWGVECTVHILAVKVNGYEMGSAAALSVQLCLVKVVNSTTQHNKGANAAAFT